jgi:hypothetical protein
MELYYVPLHHSFLEVFSYEWNLMVEAIYLQFGVMMIGACNVKEHCVCMNPSKLEMEQKGKFGTRKEFYKRYNVGILITGDQAVASQVALGTSEFLGIEAMLDRVTEEEKMFQVRFVPKPKQKAFIGVEKNIGRGRRQSASHSLAEFAEINSSSSALQAITMDELSRGAKHFYEMHIPNVAARQVKPNPFMTGHDSDDDMVVKKDHIMRGRTLSDQMQDLLASETEKQLNSGASIKHSSSDSSNSDSDSDSSSEQVKQKEKEKETGVSTPVSVGSGALSGIAEMLKKRQAEHASQVEAEAKEKEKLSIDTSGPAGERRDSVEPIKPSNTISTAKSNFLRAARRVSIVNTMKHMGNPSGAARLSAFGGSSGGLMRNLSVLSPGVGGVDDMPLEPGEVEDASGLSNHVVVSGASGQLGYFLGELRRPLINASMTAYHPVLIVTPDMPSNWTECMAAFDDIFWLKGRITNSVDFNRINIQNAYTVVLLAHRKPSKQDDEMNLDAEVLFAYLKLEKYVPASVFLTVELTVASNMAVLNSTIMRHVRQQKVRPASRQCSALLIALVVYRLLITPCPCAIIPSPLHLLTRTHSSPSWRMTQALTLRPF